MTLRTRLALVAAGAVATSIALVAVVVFYAERREQQLLIDADLRREAAAIAEALLVTGDLPEPGAASPGVVTAAAQVVRPDGTRVPLSRAAALPVTPRAREVAAGDGDRFYDDVEVDGIALRTLTVPLDVGALQVARADRELQQHLVYLGWLLALISIGGVGLAVLLGHLVAGTGLRPLQRLTAAAEHITATQNLSARISLKGRDELSRLAATLNTMLEEVDGSQRRQRQLVADASHELRTPLATLRTNLEVLERAAALPVDERARVVTDVRVEVESLITLVDDLIHLARDEPAAFDQEDLALEAVVEQCVVWARRRAPTVDISADLMPHRIRADELQVRRAVGNLLDNATKWSPPGGAIEVRLRGGELSVRDHGPGLNAADLPKVFERFYRAPAARGRPGAGLGLAIVRKVADAHGWQAAAANADGGGARFTLRLHPDSSPLLTTPSAHSQEQRANSERTQADERLRGPRHGRLRTARTPVWVTSLAAAIVVLAGIGAAVMADDGNPALVTLNGTLARCTDTFCVDDGVVDFGPSWYLRQAQAEHDLDGDGERGSLAQELGGLVGKDVTLETDGGRLDQDVYTVNGLPYRGPDGELAAPGDPPGGPPVTTSGSPDERVTRLAGRLQQCGDELCVRATALDFGPYWYQVTATALHDYDGDGRRAATAVELDGLLGRAVTLQVRGDTDDADVITIEGAPYRDARGPPPWAGGPLRQSHSTVRQTS